MNILGMEYMVYYESTITYRRVGTMGVCLGIFHIRITIG
jgi:hypothetical protein